MFEEKKGGGGMQHGGAAVKMSLIEARREWVMGSLPFISFNFIHGYFHLHLRATLFETHTSHKWKENVLRT